ncbi:serine/threonine protein kinase [Streptomyces antnestii]|uniref:Serine/threonine protein kinase n=1 Tax=Streptomyces antnestii TaxID=2494256 RepID=A0A437P3L2_9ACTN|nr:serine/threonine-protein kinase [Streptomyces sp. San01]RVU16806.1 serine/threonine protein kinase [Streptomyces sp. San01]
MPPLRSTGPGREAEHPEYAGQYRLESCLGGGGMGVVHLATSASGLRLAIKVVHAEYAADPEFRARFRQEVNAARRVSGAFTAPVVDADPNAELPWMATLFIPGDTLAERVKRNGALAPDDVRRLGAGLAEALRDIHRAGVVHRDLKPSNVLLAADGPKVIDFGISRPTDSDLRTETGKLIGSPPFMAPEQFQRPREVGPAADVFAMGAVLAHAATGRGPFDSNSPYIVAYQVVHNEPDLAGAPEDLAPLIRRCLAKDPGERPLPGEIMEALRLPATAGAGTTGSGAGAFIPAQRRPSGQPLAEGGREQSTQWTRRIRRQDRPASASVSASAGQDSPASRADQPTHHRPSKRATPESLRQRRRWALTAGAVLALAAVGAGIALYAAEDGDGTGPGPGGTAVRQQARSFKPWHTNLGGASDTAPACVSGAGALYCVSGGRTTRLDPLNGHVMWASAAAGERHSSGTAARRATPAAPTLSGGLLQLVDGGRIRALDPRTGEDRWAVDASAYEAVEHGADTTLLIGSGGTVRALNSTTGKPRWTKHVGGLGTQWIAGPGDDGEFFAVTASADGATTSVSAIDAHGGAVRWTAETAGSLSPFGASDGAVYLLSSNTDLLVDAVVRLDTADRTAHRFPLTTPADQAEATESGGTAYVYGAGGSLVAVDTTATRRQSAVRWRLETSASRPSRPVVSDRRLYLTAPDGRLLATDLRTGKPLGQTRPRLGSEPGRVVGELPAPVVGEGGRVYGSAPDGSVFAVDGRNPASW